jgi:hypothetical protein
VYQRNGHGALLTNNGHIYVGNFVNGKPEGEGHLIYFNGEQYIGAFRTGEFSGDGTFYYDSGKRYQGQWMNNRMHGEGSVYNATGDLEWSGIWAAGRKMKQSEAIAAAPSESESDAPSEVTGLSPQAANAVRLIQGYLIDLGFLQGSADGVPGPDTKSAMRKIIPDLPTVHHARLNTLTWTDSTDLEIAAKTVRAYIAEPAGQCKIRGYVYGFCFNSAD